MYVRYRSDVSDKQLISICIPYLDASLLKEVNKVCFVQVKASFSLDIVNFDLLARKETEYVAGCLTSPKKICPNFLRRFGI